MFPTCTGSGANPRHLVHDRFVTSPGWLARYEAGDRERVWHELRQLGAAVRRDEYLSEAEQVCDAMARRARRNVDALVQRLVSGGHRFHVNDGEQAPATAHVAPTEAAGAHAHWLEERFGPVPLTLQSWIREVGDVWLVGTHPAWSDSASADPLVLEVEGSRYPGSSMRDFLESEEEGWRDSVGNEVDEDP